jgi:hypothetical protein
MPRSGEKRKLFHRRDAEDTDKKFEIRNSKSELPPRRLGGEFQAFLRRYYFRAACASRHAVYQEIKSGRPRFRIISLLKRWSQNDRGFRLSR